MQWEVEHAQDIPVVREWPVRLVIVQHGAVVKYSTATSITRRRESSDHSRGQRHRLTRTDRAQSDDGCPRSDRSDASRSKSAEDLYIDTKSYFNVVLYRHKDCSRLKRGFWHSETLNGHSRMGNALDRSHVDRSAIDCANACLTRNKSPSYHVNPTTYGQPTDIDERDWVLMGQLSRKVDMPTGAYSIRLSPSMSPSMDDHLFMFKYEDHENFSPPAHQKRASLSAQLPGRLCHKRSSSVMNETGHRVSWLLSHPSMKTSAICRVSRLSPRTRSTCERFSSGSRDGTSIPEEPHVSVSSPKYMSYPATPLKRKLCPFDAQALASDTYLDSLVVSAEHEESPPKRHAHIGVFGNPELENRFRDAHL